MHLLQITVFAKLSGIVGCRVGRGAVDCRGFLERVGNQLDQLVVLDSTSTRDDHGGLRCNAQTCKRVKSVCDIALTRSTVPKIERPSAWSGYAAS